MAEVQILLSTWNGERWLNELLSSLSRQSYLDWELLVRDDGSKDQTSKILLEWQYTHPSKLARFDLDGQHLGSTASFNRLVLQSHAPYLMFCDQDDVWFPEKIELALSAMQSLEQRYGAKQPLLVHTDMAVVDADKALLATSFWQLRHFDIAQRKQAYLLNNNVSGCASLFNRAAADMAFPLPQGAIQHDRWLALVVAWFGYIEAITQPLMFYRQHANNEIGAFAKERHLQNIHEKIDAWSKQAEAFLNDYSQQMAAEDYQIVQALAELQYLSGWERRRHILQHRLFKQGVLTNLALLLFA